MFENKTARDYYDAVMNMPEVVERRNREWLFLSNALRLFSDTMLEYTDMHPTRDYETRPHLHVSIEFVNGDDISKNSQWYNLAIDRDIHLKIDKLPQHLKLVSFLRLKMHNIGCM
ncbi:MAG TPA: hypothetical protein VGT41_00550 [Candidatus Babeliales bacterium]|nr:hypothetical protein [Candidatus Babeliales bacterium]